jgi:hypothetical protein
LAIVRYCTTAPHSNFSAAKPITCSLLHSCSSTPRLGLNLITHATIPLDRNSIALKRSDMAGTNKRMTTRSQASKMPGSNNRSSNSNVDATPKGMQPMADDNDTARIKNLLEIGATASEIVSEAYRVCRINGFLRRDLAEVRDQIRTDRKEKAVREDALAEMRHELPATRNMLERAWGLLQSRKVKIPDDRKTAYEALTAKDPHDWQSNKGLKTQKGAPKEKEKEKD